MRDWLQGRKVNLVAIGGILASIGGYLSHQMTLQETGAAIWVSLLALAGRSTAAKIEKVLKK